MPLPFIGEEEEDFMLMNLMKKLLKIYEHNLKVHQAMIYEPLLQQKSI